MIKCYGGDHPMEHGLISCIWIWHNAIFRSYNMLHTVCSIHNTLMLWQHACFSNIPFWNRLVARPESSFGFDIFPPIITTLQISSSDLTFSKSHFRWQWCWWHRYVRDFMMVTDSNVGGRIIMLATFFIMLVIFSMY